MRMTMKRILTALALFASIFTATMVPRAPASAVPVTQISLTNAITALTRTSSSGVTPMTWTVSFGSNVYAGYGVRARVFSTSAMTGTPSQDVLYTLTNDDITSGNLSAGLAAAGLTSIGATEWLHLAVFTTSPNGLGFYYADAVPISPTDAAVPMVWSVTDHRSGMVLSNGNLTIGSAGTWSGARVSRAIGAGKKVYVEMTGDCYAAVATSTASLTDAHGGAPGDGTATNQAAEYQPFGQLIFFNGSSAATPTAYLGPSTVIGITIDTTGTDPVVTFRYNNVLQGSRTMTGVTGPLYFMTTMPNGKSTTLNAGTTPGGTAGFTFTPPPGFVAP